MKKEKFKGKYRIESARLKNYDYSKKGIYFITIMTKDRNHFFGKIENDRMVLNKTGLIVQNSWNAIPFHFSFIKLDQMQIMPNHIHCILWIVDSNIDGGNDVDVVGGVVHAVGGRDVACNVSTETETEIPKKIKNKKMAKISPKSGSLSTVIRSFKSAITKNTRQYNPKFAWQPRFHDRIIRDKYELNRIRNYIIKNPEMWQHDRNNK